jgi:hypothetical protein
MHLGPIKPILIPYNIYIYIYIYIYIHFVMLRYIKKKSLIEIHDRPIENYHFTMSYKESGIKCNDVTENIIDINWKYKNIDFFF